MTIHSAVLLASIGLFFLSPVISMAQDADLAQQNFLEADANADGALAYSEFATFIDLNAADGVGNAAMISERGLHARAFGRLDANGDGAVSAQELPALQQ